MEHQVTYVGIDVSKVRVDVAVRPSGDGWSVNYDESGVAALVVHLQAMNPAPVLLEASGGMDNSHGVSLGGGRVAGGGSQPPPSEGLCQGHGPAGQDRRTGCPSSCPFRRGRPAGVAPCCARFPGWANSSPCRSWHICRNWVHWTESRLLRSSVWRPSIGTAE